MAKGNNQKLKILYLMKILLEKTDEENTITLNEMIMELGNYGIDAERKSIYDDLEALRQYGINVATRKTKTTEYYVANRLFETSELKLLVDIVQFSELITLKKSNDLIKKIESLTSMHQAKKLQSEAYVANRVKATNKLFYCDINTIHIAISENRQISFKYLERNLNKKKQFKNFGQIYIVSPYALFWIDENYYLISYYSKNSKLAHFRVDRMTEVKLLKEPRRVIEDIISDKSLETTELSKKVINIFGEEVVAVKLQFDNSLVNVMEDRFGNEGYIEKVDENSFTLKIHVNVSSKFLSWLFQFGHKVKILSPESVVKRYKQNLLETINLY